MTEKKMTKREHFGVIRAIVDTHPEVPASTKAASLAFIDHEVEMLSRKHSAGGADAKKKAEQAKSKAAIVAALSDASEPMRATAIAGKTGDSVQKVTAMVRALIDAGEVVREVDGKVSTFRLA